MEQVRMKRSFTYEVPDRPGVTRTVPAGWAGSLPDEVAAAAEDEGAAIIDRPEGKSRSGKVGGRGRGARRGRATAAPSTAETAERGSEGGGDTDEGATEQVAGGSGGDEEPQGPEA